MLLSFYRKSFEPEEFYSRETDGHLGETTDNAALETACCVCTYSVVNLKAVYLQKKSTIINLTEPC